MEAFVFGNATLDVICHPVDDVPRKTSISFERSIVSPGGCGSNVAVGLRSLGVNTALVARVGSDEAGDMARRYWDRLGIDCNFIRRDPERQTGVSIGLVDSAFQPRFVHTSGANALLSVDDLDLSGLASTGGRYLHIAGFYVLPGLLDGRLPFSLQRARRLGFVTSLDVVESPRMRDPEILWPCLPHLDYFLCNAHEAQRLTGEVDPIRAVGVLRAHGAQTVIIKLGADGCLVDGNLASGEQISRRIPAPQVDVVDTTGAGDAFAAGLIAGLLRGQDLIEACESANAAGAKVVKELGAITAWLKS
jgi:sugar/nucleoside kinase (ribokinase family)